MKYTITLDRDEDGLWIALCPGIPGSQGSTKEAAVEHIEDAVRGCLEARSELGYSFLETV